LCVAFINQQRRGYANIHGVLIVARKRMKFPMFAVLLLLGSVTMCVVAVSVLYVSGEDELQTPKMAMVSHTEYRYGEPGQIIARLTDFEGNPVVVNNCTATIKYPDKTAFVSGALMAVSTVSGDYYYNFTTPTGPEGVYEYQATCTYASGSKSASVTNSFHLSSAFTSVLGNVSQMQTTLNGVAANVSTVQSQLLSINTSLSNQIAQNISSVLTQLSEVNASLSGQVSTGFATVQSNFSSVLEQLASINETISTLNVSVDLSPVLTAITDMNATMAQYYMQLGVDITQVNTTVNNIQAGQASNFSVITSYLSYINATMVTTDYTSALAEINATTQSTYSYVTTTLAGKVDDTLIQLGIMNATLNRIELMTGVINSTTSQILQNQENAVNMQVFSG
jgi:hypothetical protein